MFTVKWCTESNGVTREKIFHTDSVQWAWPSKFPKKDRSVIPEKLGIYDIPDGGLLVIGNPSEGADSMAFAHGLVYVMNEQGRTVAKYHLASCDADDPVPLAAPDAKAA